jgi:isopenicillin N synthase-like dioxygenase
LSFVVHTVDLREFLEGSPSERQSFSRQIGESLKNTGFVKVSGHSITPQRLNHAYQDIKAFFALPEVTKNQYIVQGSGGARGYTSFGQEHAKDNPIPDLKEFWHVGQENPPDGFDPSIYFKNLWPHETPRFKESLWSLYRDLEVCSQQLLESLELYFDLTHRHLADMVVQGNSILRLIHYPALKDRFIPGGVRASAHEDINLITLLPAATESGLELQDREGHWHAVDGLEGEIVVDAGDMLSRHVNGIIPSTTHRVVNPKSPDDVRYSMPFFAHPRPEVILDCPPSLLKEGALKKYSPIRANDFLIQRLIEIGLIKP